MAHAVTRTAQHLILTCVHLSSHPLLQAGVARAVTNSFRQASKRSLKHDDQCAYMQEVRK